MNKNVRIIVSSVISLVVFAVVFAIIFSVFNSNDSPKPPINTQLGVVDNIEYDKDTNILSWEEIDFADSYNVSINDKVESVNETYYTVDVDPSITYYIVKIQACDSTGTYLSSEWSKPFEITLTKQESLVSAVNEFAESIPSDAYTMHNVVSIHADGSHLFTTAVYERMGKDYILTYDTDCGETITSLEEALKTQNVNEKTYTDSKNLAKHYDTASSFLARSEYSEQIQALADQQYDLSFVTSQAYEITSNTIGLKGILKATKGNESDYYSIDLEIGVGDFTNETYKYTNAVEDVIQKGIMEHTFVELTGDFKEYAQQVEEMQASQNSN